MNKILINEEEERMELRDLVLTMANEQRLTSKSDGLSDVNVNSTTLLTSLKTSTTT